MTAPAVAPRRRPGRPRANGTGPADPREDVLRHAAALFSSKGIGATRMRDIADAVGVSPPALYYHFDNVDAIVGALLRYVVVDSAAFATAAATGDGTAAGRLHSLVAHHVDRLTSGPYDLWFVAGMSDDVRARFPDVTRHATRWRRAVASVVRDGVAGGELAPVDPRLAVASVSGLVYGALELRHHGTTVDPEAVAALAVAALHAVTYPRAPCHGCSDPRASSS